MSVTDLPLESPSPAAPKADKLDDIMLAMDVVDTLRHEREMVVGDLNAVERREDLIARLRGIYKAQGISVPDDVLMDGVMALEEERFAFHPPKNGLMTRLARMYISRRKWLPLLYTLGFIIGSVLAVNYVGFVRPAKVEAKRQDVFIAKEIPARLEAARERAQTVAKTPALKTRAQDLYDNGMAAAKVRDVAGAKSRALELEGLADQLSQSYKLRIISRFNEASGIYLDSKVNPDIRNFYLIVEAVSPSGEVLTLPIEDEEYKIQKRVKKFGVRVPKAVFDRVAADKKDDQIIQNDILGQKPRGVLTPTFIFAQANADTNAPVGYIVEW